MITVIGKSKAAMSMITDALASREPVITNKIQLVNNLGLEGEIKIKGFFIEEVTEHNKFSISNIMGAVMPDTKKTLYGLFRFPYDTLINYNAFVSNNAKIGKGSLIDMGAIVCSGVETGIFTTLYSCNVNHHSKLGDYVTICPGAIICGSVKVGKGTFIGAGAVIKNDVTIGDNCFIGAGAIVLKDVKDGQTVYGNPAKAAKEKKECEQSV